MRMDSTTYVKVVNAPQAHYEVIDSPVEDPLLKTEHNVKTKTKGPMSRPHLAMRRKWSVDSSASASSTASLPMRLTLDLARAQPIAAVIPPHTSTPHGGFTPTSPVYESLRTLHAASTRRRFPRLRALFAGDDAAGVPALSDGSSAGSPPSSPGSTFSSIPSISRTTSFSEHEPDGAPHTFATGSGAPVVPPPSTMRRTSHGSFAAPLPRRRMSCSPAPVGMDPILAAAEDASRLRTQCCCTNCGATGHNFPRNARTGAMFCSRECRLAARERSRAMPI